MTDATKLKAQTVKDLAEMARRKGVAGWRSMRKDQLIRALLKHGKLPSGKAAAKASNGRPAAKVVNGKPHGAKPINGNGVVNGKHGKSQPETRRGSAVARDGHAKPRSPRIERRLQEAHVRASRSKNLAGDAAECTRDRLVVMVRDSYWLQAYWELTRQSIERARVAMGQNWHGAKPVLRLHELHADGTTANGRKVLKQIEVHGGLNNWYVHVNDPPKTYQIDLGYVAVCGKFYALARSNVVKTPPVGASEAFDGNWASVAEDYDRIYAMSGGYTDDGNHSELREVFEEHLQRPMGPSTATRFGHLLPANGGKDHLFRLEVDAELVVFGTAEPGASVTLHGMPVKLEPDGSFKVRCHFPDRRQVVPVVAHSADGAEQRTVVLAVERNTKVMEPVAREAAE